MTATTCDAPASRWSAALSLHPRDLRIGAALLLLAGLLQPVLPATGWACPLLTITGVPCPLCGMSSGVVAAVRLDVVGAAAANPAALVAVAAAGYLLFRRRPLRLHLLLLGVSIALSWAFQLHRFGIL